MNVRILPLTQSSSFLSIASLGMAAALLLPACNKTDSAEETAAPQVEELEEEKAPEKSHELEVDTAATKVTFEMDAELEKIYGKAPESTSGSLHIIASDIEKTTGLFKIDLLQLTISQQKRENAGDEFGEEVVNEKQNEHMRTWLQISEDGPKEQVLANRYVEFKIEKVKAQGDADLTKQAGAARKVDVEITGSLRLHGRATTHTFPAEAVFTFKGDEPSSVQVTTKKPLGVELEKHEVQPRSAFDILADKGLAALGAKVSKVAMVSLDLKAALK